MATAESWLRDLTDLFTPTSGQFSAAAGHRAAIEARLDLTLGVSEMFEIGSLRHGTGVWSFSDADYLVSLKGIKPTSPQTALEKVKSELQDRFTSTTIVIRRPAVVCRFSDGDVEVVPAYASAGGGFSIADPTGGWMLTHPKDHNKYVTKINGQHNGAVKKLARQVKVWKYQRNVPISSCYLEMRAAKHMEGESSYSALIDLYLALNKMKTAELAEMNDPTGLGSRFGSCSSESNRLDAMSKLNRAVSRALKAKDFAKDGEHEKAIEQLEMLFNR